MLDWCRPKERAEVVDARCTIRQSKGQDDVPHDIDHSARGAALKQVWGDDLTYLLESAAERRQHILLRAAKKRDLQVQKFVLRDRVVSLRFYGSGGRLRQCVSVHSA